MKLRRWLSAKWCNHLHRRQARRYHRKVKNDPTIVARSTWASEAYARGWLDHEEVKR